MFRAADSTLLSAKQILIGETMSIRGKAEVRKSLRSLVKEIAVRKLAQGAALVVSFVAVVAGKATDPKWSMTINMTSGVDGGVDSFVFADDSGKVKQFQTVDAAIKLIAALHEDSVGNYTVSLETAALYASKVPADIYTDAQNKIDKLRRVKAGQVLKLSALEALCSGPYAGWESGNSSQVAKLQETLDQASVIDADILVIDDEVARLLALVASKP